ncbi:hypothetical protein DYB32_010226 [Aphanomyces invadans]|uniref:Apple domain-containing protein n=1 Tax=Aphanomyces invadans TaxID=157072 RepID=A0A3R6XZQ9_9STRA|nr:hypothetical protein DYB32_010620 [Aphanomyces invadans]RHY19467.1 hypothetical protein DYB32_010226 [Aphanomyces invadans]
MKVAVVLTVLAAAAQATIGSSEVLRSLEETSTPSVNESFAEPNLVESPDEREAAIAASSTAAEAPLGPTEAAIAPAEAAFPPYHWPRCHKAEDGYSYSDYDIDVKHRHDHRQCCDECSKTHGCVFYVWTPGHYGGKCHLKSKVGKQHRLPGAKAAKVNKPVVECEKLQHHKYNHRDYFDHFKSHARDCCQSCLAHYKCAGYTHKHGVCYLHAKLGRAVYKKVATSGVRDD